MIFYYTMIIAIFFSITTFLLAIYCLLILTYRYWLIRLKIYATALSYKPVSFFSIIIPARNEEDNIGQCLSSIFKNNYPENLYEVIVINDESTDRTEQIIQSFQEQNSSLHLLQMCDLLQGQKINAYKKKAIEAAIATAAGAWIVTTDADCIVPENWLANFDHYIQRSGKKFIAAPVAFIDDHTFLGRFQCLDFLSLQGITAASVSAGFHSMCNGANLCYEKALFHEVNGFENISHIASGDDMLLMHKVQQRNADDIGYLYTPQSIVATQPVKTWKAFINQRIRWASKASDYTDWKIKLVLWLVYLLNVCMAATFIVALFHPVMLIYWLGLLLIKTITELFFMAKIAGFYKQQSLLKWFPLMQPLHILYTVAAGFLGRFGTYQWKEREVQ